MEKTRGRFSRDEKFQMWQEARKRFPGADVRWIKDRLWAGAQEVDPQGMGSTGAPAMVAPKDAASPLDEIAGQPRARAMLQRLALLLRYRALFGAFGVTPPRGVLLYGPPGAGKSHAARCLARSVQCPMVQVSYAEIASVYVDGSLTGMKQVLETIRGQCAEGPLVLFMDEVDAFFPSRMENDVHGNDRKLVNFLLEWMDGGLDPSNPVTIIGATNLPEGMDPAAMRAGRFEYLVEFEALTPDALWEVVQLHRGLREREAGRRLFGEIDPDTVKPALTGLVGSDIPALLGLCLGNLASHLLNEVPMLRTLPQTQEMREAIHNALSQRPLLVENEHLLHAIHQYVHEVRGASPQEARNIGFRLPESHEMPPTPHLGKGGKEGEMTS